MESWLLYLQLGFKHITDLNGYDHMLFLVALCAVYALRQWRQVLVLVTAFTLGHSLTLALAALRLVAVPTAFIELLIPVTIFITAISNFFFREENAASPRLRYAMAAGFGLIHGLGFSNYLRSLLGREASITGPLLAFNIGLELGQLCIIAGVLAVSWLLTARLGVPRRDWRLVISGAVAGVALMLIKDAEWWAG